MVYNEMVSIVMEPRADPALKFRVGDFSIIWQSSFIFRIVKNHGEKGYFRRF